MKRIIINLLVLIIAFSKSFAQQSERVDLGEATSAITNTVNALNTLYQDLSKQGEVDAEINQKIRSISTMAFPCREAIINASYNVRSMSEDKKAIIVSIAQNLESEVNAIDKSSSKETIVSNLNNAENKINEFTRTLHIKIKKLKKK